MPLIGKPFGLTSGVAAVAAYTIDNSCMFDGAADYLSWTPGGAADNADKQTFSFWVKRSGLSANEQIITAPGDIIGFTSGDAFDVQMGSTYDGRITTSALYRDPTAWMHFVYIYDSANAIGDQRMRLFVNGIAVSSFSTQNNPTQNADGFLTAEEHNIGRSQPDSDFYYDGYLAEFIGLDGTAADASSFGEFNSDGVWIPIDPSGLTFGNNGFWLDFEDSSDLGNDVSGNDNDWTSSGLAAANQVLDSPTDSGTTIGNYATWNPLFLNASMDGTATNTYSNGNRTYIGGDAGGGGMPCSTVPMAIGSNSYYVEVTYDVVSAGYQYTGLSFIPTTPASGWGNIFFYASDDGKLYTESGNSTYGATWGAGDAIGIYYDNDNDELSFYKNGVDQGVAVSSFSNNGSIAHVCCYFGRSTDKATINSGQTAFTGTAPEGALPLCTANLPAPTITKPTDNFLPIVYEGNGAGQRVGDFIPFTDTFAVDDSCRFDEGDADSLYATWGGAGDTQKVTISFWMKRGNIDSQMSLISANSTAATTATDQINIIASNALRTRGDNGNDWNLVTDRLFEDTSSWHHVVLAIDTTQTTAADRINMYFDGVLLTNFSTETYPTLNFAMTGFNAARKHFVATNDDANLYFDGYLAEICYVDGTQYAASDFGETDTSTNRWIPKDPSGLTFGTNGFYLAFASENNLGDDTSGNGNDLTESNLDSTNGSNQMYDTPSQNFCTWNPAWKDSEAVLTEGNLKAVGASTSSADRIDSTMFFPSTGKYYYEARVDAVDSTYPATGGGIFSSNFNSHPSQTGLGGFVILNNTTAKVYVFNHVETASYTGTTLAAGDVIGVAINMDTGKFWFSYNGTFLGSGDPEAGTNESGSIPAGMSTVMPSLSGYNGAGVTGNFGQWRYFDGATTTLDSDAGGYFQSTSVPSGFKALQQDNLPANTAGITGFSWIKNRDASDPHILQNSVEGIYNYMSSNDHLQQITNTNSVQRFLQQGVQIGNMDAVNTSAESFVLWQWANDGGAGSVNGDGDTDITLAVNSTAGFSYGLATSPSSGGFTVGHGLGVQPSFVIQKNTNADNGWNCWHKDLTNETSYWVDLYDDGAEDSSTVIWNNTAPTTSVMSANADWYSASRIGLWMFFAQVEGYSSFGSYTGNGSGSYAVDYDGPFIYTGFKPAFVLIKRIDSTGNWVIFDDKRSPINPRALQLHPNLTNVDGAGNDQDFLANGWKVRSNGSDVNASGGDYIYAAFAENPFGGSGVAQAKAV